MQGSLKFQIITWGIPSRSLKCRPAPWREIYIYTTSKQKLGKKISSRPSGMGDYRIKDRIGNDESKLLVYFDFIDKFCIDIAVSMTLLHMIVCYCLGMSTASSDSTLYKCEVCNKTFNSQKGIEQHNKETHIETAGQKE